jgi:hypothetical protein
MAVTIRQISVPVFERLLKTLTGWLDKATAHATTAYNMLRHNGLPLGKRDFLG